MAQPGQYTDYYNANTYLAPYHHQQLMANQMGHQNMPNAQSHYRHLQVSADYMQAADYNRAAAAASDMWAQKFHGF